MSALDVPRPAEHVITIVVGGMQLTGWTRYELTLDMLRPDDHFSASIPWSRKVWDQCAEDSPIKFFIDDVQFLEGFIDSRDVPEDDDDRIDIIARDRMGRVTQESAPGIHFAGMQANDLALAIVRPWFETITNDNSLNRRVLRGRGKKAKASSSAVKLFSQKKLGSILEPGQTRGSLLQNMMKQIGAIALSSGDGRTLFIGQPNYDQEIQFRFFKPAANSARIAESTVRGMGIHLSTADRYSKVTVVGTGTGTDENYGPRVNSLFAEAKNDPATRDGDGKDFSAPKRLIIPRQIGSKAQATELAVREMARRDAMGEVITVRAAGHGQKVASSAFVTFFVPDTLASVEHEATGVKGTYLLTTCTYRSSRQTGEETSIKLVRKGAELVTE